MKLSIVTSLYCSAPYLTEFYERVSKSAKKITDDYEIILVNDGSPDNSLEMAVSLHEADKRVKVVDLSRNFGQHKAVMTGLGVAKGDKIFLINCDLEEAPEDLELFYAELAKSPDSDVIYGMQDARKGGFFNKVFGELVYGMLNWMSGLKLDSKAAFSRLMTRRYVKSLLEFRERELFLAGIWHLAGYKQSPVAISSQYKGETTYTFKKKLVLLVTGITSFSEKPLVYIFVLGLVLSLLSGAFTVYMFANKLLFNAPIRGWTSVMVSLWFIGGLLILFMGVIGIYLSRVFIEAKRRPYSIIRKIYGTHEKEGEL